MKTPKIILEQIDKAVNPDRKLGNVKTSQPITLSYKDAEDISSEELVDLRWKKRYYSFNRGDFTSLDIEKFINFFGKIYRTEVNGEYGNFVDYLPEPYSNVQYSVDVYVANDILISLYIELASGSVAIFVNNNFVFSSPSDNFYISAQHSIFLSKGWNRIDIFVYHKNSGAEVVLKSDLAKKINSWRSVDFVPPDSPEWYTTPIETEYINPQVGPELQNVIRWFNPRIQNPDSTVRGWGVYRYENEIIKDENDNTINIISGWGDIGFTVLGDKRNYFPAQMEVGPGLATYYVVSGTEWHPDDGETLVNISGTGYDFDVFAGSPIGRRFYRHLFDVELDMSIGYVVSGIDKEGIIHGHYYSYALDAYDDSVNKNRSEKSSVQTHLSGDFDPPPRITTNDIVITNGGLKRITTTIKNPDRWLNKPEVNDVKGYRVWTTANPTSPYDDYLVGDFPINVSGSNTRLDITQTISGTTLVPLDDVTTYTFYISTYDHYGNELLTSLPSITATTSVFIKTGAGDDRVVVDNSNNSIRIYVSTAKAV